MLFTQKVTVGGQISHADAGLAFEAIPRLEDKPDDPKTNAGKDCNGQKAKRDRHVGHAKERPAKPGDQVHDRIKQGDLLPKWGEHGYRIE